MTLRARKHAVMTDIEKFEKRDKRLHRSLGTSPYHTSRRFRQGRKASDGWKYTYDHNWWLVVGGETKGYVAVYPTGTYGTKYVFSAESVTFVQKKCETLAEAKRFVEGKEE